MDEKIVKIKKSIAEFEIKLGIFHFSFKRWASKRTASSFNPALGMQNQGSGYNH